MAFGVWCSDPLAGDATSAPSSRLGSRGGLRLPVPRRCHRCLPSLGTRGHLGGCAPASCRAEPGVYRPGVLLGADGRQGFAVSTKVQGPAPFSLQCTLLLRSPWATPVLDKLVQAELDTTVRQKAHSRNVCQPSALLQSTPLCTGPPMSPASSRLTPQP